MSRVIVIDGGAIQFRSIFAWRAQQFGTAPSLFMRMIIGYFKRLNVTLDDTIILALDFGSWRKAVDKTYKAQRQAFRESKEEQSWWEQRYAEFNDLYENIKISMPVHVIKIFNAEADDIISVCCRVYIDKEILIISQDRDLEQLAYFSNVKIFSPITKKFKEIPNPMKILLEKIQGDISDNLLDKPTSEAEFEKRKKIVDLINPLPNNIELSIKDELNRLQPKGLHLSKVAFRKAREELHKLYNI